MMPVPWWIIPLLGYLAYTRFRKPAQGAAAGQSAATSPAAVAFSMHMLVLVNAVLYIIPLVAYIAQIPSLVFYRMTFMASAFVCVYTIWTNYGLPPVRSGMQSFQMWMSRVTLGADFPFLFMSCNTVLLATGSFIPNIFGLFVIVRRSIWYCGTFANSHLAGVPFWVKIQPFWLKLKSREADIMRVSTICELGIGFQYLINLFTPYREIMACFLYWSLLRIRYQAPRSSAHHHEAWSIVDAKTQTVTSLPVITNIVQYGKKWFNQSLVAQQAQ